MNPTTTTPPAVDILLPELNARDATGVHTRHLRDLLVEDGHRVRLVVERPTELDEDVTLLRDWEPSPVVVLQHSIGSEVANEVVKRRVPVVLNYHNVTPAEFVEPWEPGQISGLRWGRAQLWELGPLVRLGVAVSGYNARDLREVGIAAVEVVPVMFPVETVAEVPAGPGSVVRVLFVGRLAPNKCQHDVIAAVAVLEGLLADSGRSVELVLVGGSSSVGFEAALRGLVSGLGLDGRVVFAGSVSEAELARWYSVADVFVCLSEHEGFGVPLVEAMAAGVPVVAFGAAAVPETVGSAGVVLGDKSPVVVAEAVLRVVSDEGVRRALVEAGLARVAELGPEVAGARMREVLAPVLAEAGA